MRWWERMQIMVALDHHFYGGGWWGAIVRVAWREMLETFRRKPSQEAGEELLRELED